MPDTLPGQEKKDSSDIKSYDERVTVRQWAGGKGGGFVKPVDNVPAYRKEIKGQQVFYTHSPGGSTESPPKSEIIDKDGTVWVVDKVTKASQFHINYVTKKPTEKKP